jgi:uncharacterized protein (TIGR00369 family)
MSDQPTGIFQDSPLSGFAKAFLEGIPFARAAGMQAERMSQARGSVTMAASEAWTGHAAANQIHPGCLAVLADTACGLAVGAAMNPIEPYATLDLRMDYLRPARAGLELRCDAHCHRLSRSVAFVRGEVFQPGSDEAVAAVNATFMLATANTRRQDLPGGARPPKTDHAKADRPAAMAHAEAAPMWRGGSAVLAQGQSPYVDFLGIERQISLDGQEGDVFRMPFRPELIGNPVLPALHGGVVAGFAESAALLHLIFSNAPDADPHATQAHEGSAPRGVDFSIDYLRSAKPIDTFARCTTVRQGSRVALVHVTVWQDDPSRPIVSARSHCLLPRG